MNINNKKFCKFLIFKDFLFTIIKFNTNYMRIDSA